MFSKRNKFKNEYLVGDCRMTGVQLKAASHLRSKATYACYLKCSF